MGLFRITTMLFVIVGAFGLVSQAEEKPSELLEQMADSELVIANAVAVEKLQISAGPGTMLLREGILFPTGPLNGSVREVVFIGDALLELESPDELEAQQLSLFTGSGSIEQTIREAVMVICSDQAMQALLKRPVAQSVDEETRLRAEELYASWRSSSERRLLDVESAMLLDAMGDPFYETYFVGTFHSEELGKFLMASDPAAEEQVTLGQFIALEATEKEKRKATKWIHRAQRKGRLIGLELEDLGTWNTWLSTQLRDPQGEAYAGSAGFEPEHYNLEITLADPGKEATGKAQLSLKATTSVRQVVALSLQSDLIIDGVRDGNGKELEFTRSGTSALVFLDATPQEGDSVEISVDYHGPVLDKLKTKLFRLRHTSLWYPHVGHMDSATYDVTLRWPARLDLVASGRLVDEGETEGGLSWERRKLEYPTGAFSFELGDYDIERIAVGDIAIRIAFDRESSRVSEEIREQVLTTVQDTLTFYQEVFGGYPLKYLTVVTAPRGYSQGFLGFVSLSSVQMLDLGVFARILGIADRRVVIAHELAHQWWGNLVGSRSYRDEWIVEAMANYSAMVWAKRNLKGEDAPTVNLIANWKSQLLSLTKEGRPVESLGPLVMGRRLDSSHAAAFDSIVYKKGAVVVNMLHHNFGEEAFLKMLAKLVEVGAGKRISTADYLLVLEKTSGQELDWFGNQYVYGTGLPELYYTYEFDQKPDNKWVVRGETQQQVPYYYRYSVVHKDNGGFDVRREGVKEIEREEPASMIVPVQISIYRPEAEQNRSRRKKKGPKEPNSIMSGRLFVDKENADFEFEIGHQPFKLWLDRDAVVFGRFFNEERAPKRMLWYHGLDSAALGEFEKAEELFGKALAADVSNEEAEGTYERRVNKSEAGYLDARVRMELAWLYLDQGRLDDAREEIKLAKGNANEAFSRATLEPRLRILESRLGVLEGRFEPALKRQRKGLRPTVSMGGTAGYVVLAIAAHGVGDDKILSKALEAAGKRGSDVSALED